MLVLLQFGPESQIIPASMTNLAELVSQYNMSLLCHIKANYFNNQYSFPPIPPPFQLGSSGPSSYVCT